MRRLSADARRIMNLRSDILDVITHGIYERDVLQRLFSLAYPELDHTWMRVPRGTVTRVGFRTDKPTIEMINVFRSIADGYLTDALSVTFNSNYSPKNIHEEMHHLGLIYFPVNMVRDKLTELESV